MLRRTGASSAFAVGRCSRWLSNHRWLRSSFNTKWLSMRNGTLSPVAPHNKQLQRTVMDKVPRHLRQRAAAELRRWAPSER
jgi:hypothetical protein